jgi:very-short-patch-repair endonuclease
LIEYRDKVTNALPEEIPLARELGESSAATPTATTFPIGNTELGLKEIRTRLIDLSNRNKLLNFRFPAASCLRFVDVNSEAAFIRIIDGGKLSVSAVPEPPDRRTEKPTALAHAKELGWNTSYDLCEVPPTDEYDGRLPVVHYAEHLNALTRKIDDAARTAIEETGANMLYLSFGFLEWYESDDSDEPRFAPLVSVPVVLDRTPGKGKAFRCDLEYSGEDFDTNLSLVEKMRRDMGLEIPLFGDGDSPSLYFQRFSDLLGVKKRWRIQRQITLSLLDFSKLLMFRDLDPKNWPADASISQHQLVRELFEGQQTTGVVRPEEFLIDDPVLQPELPALICDADSSQHSALIDALRGKNLVIEGPPGTGKSQTISNLIAEALAKGKTVLFVSDKLAALQVVRDRLEERGMGAFCLELHSHRTQKGALLKDVGRRIELSGSFEDPSDLDRLLAVVENRKRRLIEYVSLIKETVDPIRQTVFDILWAREAAFQALPFSERLVSTVTQPPFLDYTPTKFTEATDWLAIYTRNLSSVLAAYGTLDRHPWRWVQKGLSYVDEQSCLTTLPELIEALDHAIGLAHDYLPQVFRALESAPTNSLDLRSASLESRESIRYLRETAEKARRLQTQRGELSASFDLGVGSRDELIAQAGAIDRTPWFKRWFSADYRKAVKTYKAMARDHGRAEQAVMSKALRLVADANAQRAAFDKNEMHREHIGVGFIGLQSRWDDLLKLADWYERILAMFPDGKPPATFAELQAAMFHIVQLAEKLAGISGCDLWREPVADSLGEWRSAAVVSLEDREALQGWAAFVRCRVEGEPFGVTSLTTLGENGSIKPEHLGPGFDFLFYDVLAKHALSRNPALWEFSGETQQEIRQQFARTDRDIIAMQRKRAAARTANRPVHPGTRGVHVGDWTELALLRHEVGKQKRHIPIRELIRRAGTSLQALKPCFMMGPQSVAKYLPPNVLKFDLVVMDEASQIRPEDAIGAMARGGQAVIVGDPMQLPPTSFFNRLAPTDGDDGNDGQSVAADSESILDVASAVYSSVRRLRWHYRSQHESLIAFSNQEFYGDLIVFPHAQRDSETMGIKYRFVSEAIYEERRNPKEASAVVDAVLDHMKTHPTESLGVVTMNFEQRELIEGLLEDRLRDDPFAQSFHASMTGTKAFFVKNLENVQGDERDVIFISTTYGPDASGNQFQRFGPVNSEAGHRRLNVLFTRAKLRTVVFTSLDVDRILATPESSRGLRAFKGYLQFARSGILDKTTSTGDQEINDFERSVRAVIEARNYEAIPQVGVAGFFIDLAVKNPKKPGVFLLGIECDGATYHSGKSVRDRDRLREEILRSRGWTLHRIWSTDWFKNRNKEIDKMFKRIESMVNTQAS